jgi:hypothetical protein
MKFKGKKLEGPNEVIIPILRDGEDMIFKARAVLSYEEFDRVCPVPKPPMVLLKGNDEATPALKDPKYMKAMDEYSLKRSAFMIITSLSATPELEWESVKMDDPSTWIGYEEELRKAGLSAMEIGRLIGGVLDANGLDEQKIEEAKKRFLASQRVAVA